MNATCTHTADGRVRDPSRRTGGPCRYREPAGLDLDEVMRRIGSGRPMTVPELLRAAAVLARHVASGRTDVLVARVRVAVALEELGA
ncbi:hypothetical protein GCU56_08490 [Geodermatophilus sabuli]|uniref:Uncharacterized protein n=1 Tax=Geodermatophilus sabuli TaxID=1564158 RepID=A0A7K3W1X1_9ACTN|nr:hypothetical protein [Geodermatophilus sabuli]NEK57907.1 hypothetical protein [Geodermatophilus sabuli]